MKHQTKAKEKSQIKRQLISMVAATVVFVIPFTATAVHASLLTPPEMLSGIEKQNQSLNISWDALWRAYQRGKNSQLDVGT